MTRKADKSQDRQSTPRGSGHHSARFASFVVGAVLSFAICAAVGWKASSSNIFRDFGRFHTRLTPESFFQPTAREVMSLARELLDKNKVNVVIGGSSVFYGVGQPEGQTIADNLRRDLGDNYRVINLAMRGGDVSGIAEQTVEMLLREQYRVVYVSDIAVGGTVTLLGSTPYQYYFWDARARNLLIDWPARDQRLTLPWYAEQRMSAMLNKYLYFMDLWNTIGYDYVFTVYSTLIPGHFWQARKNLPDNEIDPPEQFRYRNGELELQLIKRISEMPTEPEWKLVGTALETALPDAVRKSAVLAVCENSPWLLQQTAPETQAIRKAMRERMVKRVTEVGPSSFLACEGFEKDDYIDRVHLSVSGAAKIAPRLADQVRATSRNNGWVQ